VRPAQNGDHPATPYTLAAFSYTDTGTGPNAHGDTATSGESNSSQNAHAVRPGRPRAPADAESA